MGKIELPVGIVFVSGLPSAGKTTTLSKIAKKVSNAFYLDRDAIIEGFRNIRVTKTDELLNFEKYVEKDNVFPDYGRKVLHPAFGEMIYIDPVNAYTARHVRDQTYIVQAHVTKQNLELGKLALLDCFLPRQINDKTLEKIMEQPLFEGYPKNLIHIIADPEECFNRSVKRAKNGTPEEQARHQDLIDSKEKFINSFGLGGKFYAEKIGEYNHLLLDTTGKTPEACAEECIDYISL